MGLFDWLNRKGKEERSLNTYGTSSSGAIFSMFSTSTAVSKEAALRIPSVTACSELISGSIAQLPIYLYKKNDKGEVEMVQGDRRVFLLNKEPNSLQNGYNFKKKIAQDYLFYGVSYTKMEKVRNNILELYTLDMDNVQVTKYLKDGYKWDADIKLLFYTSDKTQQQQKFKPYELISVLRDSQDGITGSGILETGADTLQLALNEIDYTGNVLKNGALPIGVIQTMNKLSETAIKRLRAGWESLYGGSKNSGKTVILEEGLEYKPISLKPNEMQLVDGKKITIAEIARLFNVPESMVNANANKYASNEQNNLYFLQYTLAPVITAIESALNKSMLLEDEKGQGYFFQFDVSEILRTTEKEKFEAATQGLKNGFVSLNETRKKLNLPHLGDDYFMWSLGSVLYNPATEEIIVPNMQGSSDLNNPIPPVVPKDNNTQSVDNNKVPVKNKPKGNNGTNT